MKKAVFLFFIFFSISCDKGLVPPGVTSISGKVHFVNAPKDSVNIFAVVLVQPRAPFSAATLISGYGVYVLPFILSSTSFRDTNYLINLKPDSTYHYLGIAQNYGYNLLRIGAS